MNSAICSGYIYHNRVTPIRHRFTYPILAYVLDVDELPRLDRELPLFGYNRRALCTIRDRDYLDDGPGTIREKLQRFLRERGVTEPPARIVMVTGAKFLGYIFNPVTFYYCFGPDGELAACAAEVNNTFRDRHLYLLPGTGEGAGDGFLARYHIPKRFYVSVFNRVEGSYRILCGDIRETMNIRVHVEREGKVFFKAGMMGAPEPLTAVRHRQLVLQSLFRPWLRFPRICRQAFHLYVRKKLPFVPRPMPEDPMTIRHRPMSSLERRAEVFLDGVFRGIRSGTMSVTLPDGRHCEYGEDDGTGHAELQIRNPRAFKRVLLHGDIGFGEGYMHRDWDTPDLPGLLSLLVRNRESIALKAVKGGPVAQAGVKAVHWLRRNTVRQSERNIREHYDLSNAFFEQFLDPTMLYSSAVFADPAMTLEAAQREKMAMLIRKARIRPEHTVLEIGCGWGALALETARTTGCRVVGITVSQAQYEAACARVKAAGLEDRVDIRLCDYRRLEGSFDRILSVEMLEAVGHQYFGAFFRTLERVLKPNGIVVLQVITIPDQRYRFYRKNPDFIQKHIFPGGLLPSLTVLTRTLSRHSSLVVEGLENIAPHYARTLAEWRRTFVANADAIASQGFDDVFRRKWLYYFGYCEAAFGTRQLEDLHLVLTRPGNPDLPGVP